MDSTSIHKNLNEIFEELYHLFNETIANPEYMINNQNIENCVIQFTDTIRVDCEWDMTVEERQELWDKYFESGHNGVNAVFYPFDSNSTEIDPNKINETLTVWRKTLDCIRDYSNRRKYYEKAIELKKKIKNLSRTISLAT